MTDREEALAALAGAQAHLETVAALLYADPLPESDVWADTAGNLAARVSELAADVREEQ